jgi:hypothetical protein
MAPTAPTCMWALTELLLEKQKGEPRIRRL